jgi:CRP-like cAMP-binding protein
LKIKDIFLLVRNVHIKSVRKGDVLIEAGSHAKDVYFIRRGLVRSFIVDAGGREITFQLYAEMDVFSNAHAILFEEQSKFTYQALETTKVFVIQYESLMEMTSKNADLLALNRRFFGKRIIQKAFQRLETLVFLTPEERYAKFLQDHRNLIPRVPDKYIANVLGITPVSLSRIRKRMASKK